MKKFLLLLSVFALFACKKDKGNDEEVVTIPASDYELSADGLTLVKWKNENTAVLNMQADAVLRNIKVIGNGAFFEHKKIGSITLPEGLTGIEAATFYGTKLRSIVIPKGVQVIGANAFAKTSLTSVQFSEGLITIDDGAFSECQIPILNFPESLQAIGRNAFDSNKVIVTVTIPKNVRDISGAVFDSCEKLSTATFKGQTPPRISTLFGTTFNYVNQTYEPTVIGRIYVPKGRAEVYKKAEGFKLYINIISEEE
ncbi:hypothetical protein HMPREF1977_2321 [Capnocytophaga ochracea F0287]|uniref:Uncharacterized protein n=1 Tax=Capnocytophaga ochracea F0287 TaxID=873517 RepID=E4MVB1_CAPOC|nr:leucine-rich repeat domain-containing protein [Capnocytophaga ochracea]EFS96405.1 hypothetical protein HMPREF1977_2321 [Capnocytophaga ochracea F0287]EJF44648.1 leucine rich repeat protein [Capnocytophaga ochracea str. Holt 25]UEB43063.1 leucine-rich repeat domain-containing protein [Capnocytophaga ochracea]